VRRALGTATLAAVVLVVLVPVAWMVLTSFKPNREITQEGTLWPVTWTTANYHRIFAERYFGSYLRNTLLVAGASVFVSLVLGSLAAYSLARFRLWAGLEKRLGFGILTVRILPPIVIAVPIFLLALQVHLLNSRLGLIVVYSAFNVSFVVWMMEGFFREIPVVLPLAAPGLVATSIFAVIVTYNEFLTALVLTTTPKAQTVPVGTATLITRIDIDWGAMSAAGVVAAIPIAVFALIVQRHLVRGLTLGAVK
jgi:multiple sugar transport system permease protein